MAKTMTLLNPDKVKADVDASVPLHTSEAGWGQGGSCTLGIVLPLSLPTSASCLVPRYTSPRVCFCAPDVAARVLPVCCIVCRHCLFQSRVRRAVANKVKQL